MHDEDLRLALELSLVESFQAPAPGPSPLRSSATWARTSTQIAEGRDKDEEMARILRLGREELVAEEERVTRLAQRESEREHQELLEQRALQRALRRSSSSSPVYTAPSSPSLASSSSSSSPSSPATTPLAQVQQWTTDDVCAWLEREGLGRHVKAFRTEVVDGPTLLEIGDSELASCLGVPLGHRRRILRFTAAARQPNPNQPQPHLLQQPQPLHQQLHFQPQRRQQQPRQRSPRQRSPRHQRQRSLEREREEQERERREEDARLARALQEEEDTLLAKQLELESSLEAGEVMDLATLEAISAAADAAAAAPPPPAPIVPPARLAPTRSAPPLRQLGSLRTQRLAQAPQEEEDHMSYEDLVSLPNVAVGVRDVDRLPTMTFKAGMTCEPSCVICLSDFATGDTLRRMECMHVFHKECVDKWLQQSKKCPSCNREMDL